MVGLNFDDSYFGQSDTVVRGADVGNPMGTMFLGDVDIVRGFSNSSVLPSAHSRN